MLTAVTMVPVAGLILHTEQVAFGESLIGCKPLFGYTIEKVITFQQNISGRLRTRETGVNRKEPD